MGTLYLRIQYMIRNKANPRKPHGSTTELWLKRRSEARSATGARHLHGGGSRSEAAKNHGESAARDAGHVKGV